MDKIGVMVAVLHQGWIRSELARWLYGTLAGETRYAVELYFSRASPVAVNRNKIAHQFLKSGEDYLLMLDADIQPLSNLLDLVEHDLDVVGGPYLIRQGDDLCVFAARDPLDDGFPLRRMTWVGTGAILIARRVLEHPDLACPFIEVLDARGLLARTEDVNFCHKARAAGFEVYAALKHTCDHIKDVSLCRVQYYVTRK